MTNIQDKMQHIPPMVKDAGDGTVLFANITALIATLTPMAQFAILVGTGVWIYFRVQDLRLASKLKKKELDK